jgi:hypothetical protein
MRNVAGPKSDAIHSTLIPVLLCGRHAIVRHGSKIDLSNFVYVVLTVACLRYNSHVILQIQEKNLFHFREI